VVGAVTLGDHATASASAKFACESIGGVAVQHVPFVLRLPMRNLVVVLDAEAHPMVAGSCSLVLWSGGDSYPVSLTVDGGDERGQLQVRACNRRLFFSQRCCSSVSLVCRTVAWSHEQ
jgi:hypothetical protein